TWILTCAGAWQCSETGMPPTQDSGGHKVFNPWPGESLALSFFEPKPADGQLLAIDSADLRVQLGETGAEAQLNMYLRSATVVERSVKLPAEAHVGAVRVDGNDVPVAKDKPELRLTFQPGAHAVV